MREELLVALPQSQVVYPIYIGTELLGSPLLLQLCQQAAHRWVILADTNTERLYGLKLQKNLADQGLKVDLIAFQPGEGHKSRATKAAIEDQMLALGCGRDSGLIALGGGIATDLGGFVASTYCRGIPLIQIPTTLLAMVDASIGGKTGVNVPAGKNMIGTIYQPLAVMMEISVLKSLPTQEWQNGIVESIKHGAILDREYFAFLEKHPKDFAGMDLPLLQKMIFESCRIKQRVVQADEHEMGIRRLLNFGHTLGHALETITQHAVPHGQAVAIGMLAESYLSLQLGLLPEASFARIVKILEAYQVSKKVSRPLTPQDFLNAMKLDKKALKATPRFVIIKDIGECLDCEGEYCQEVDPSVLDKTLKWICECLIP